MGQNGFYSETDTFSFIVPASCSGIRLDHYLVQTVGTDYSRSQIISSIKLATVTVNGAGVKAGYRLKSPDLVSGFISRPKIVGRPEPQPVDFEVIYEDESLAVISKPPGLVVHPGSGNPDNTLVNGLLYRYGDMTGVGDDQRPGIVHRLDKDTSGIMLVARTAGVQRALAQDFKDRMISKHYLALVHDIPGDNSGRIVAPIGRHPVNRQKMAVRLHSGRFAATNWKVRGIYGHYSLLDVGIETGRTHQIRVHMAHIRHPVAGDKIYGPHRQNDDFARQMLHAWRLSFKHPVKGDEMMFEAPLTLDFEDALERMGEQ